MSEQKMPALPEDARFAFPNTHPRSSSGHQSAGEALARAVMCKDMRAARAAADRLHNEAYHKGYEAGGQQERERLEPLRVAVEAAEKIEAELARAESSSERIVINNTLRAALRCVRATARALLEQNE